MCQVQVLCSSIPACLARSAPTRDRPVSPRPSDGGRGRRGRRRCESECLGDGEEESEGRERKRKIREEDERDESSDRRVFLHDWSYWE